MSEAILALDVATRMGVAEGAPGQTPNISCIDFSGGRRDATTHDIFGNAARWAMRVFSSPERPGHVVLEGLVPQYNKTIQCGLWGIIDGIASAHGIPVDEAPIQTWRLYVLGSGKLNKREAKTRAIQVCTQLGWKVRNDDEAEAACIWLHACSLQAPRLAQRIPFFMRGAA
jgi:hypothetical protein